MPKRRILWFPVRGIDKTLPKSMESTSGQQITDAVAYAADGSEVSTYNSRDLVTRRDLRAYSGVNYSAVYGLLKYTRGLAVAGSSGIYLDSSLKESRTLSAFTYMAPWYQSLYWSTGSAWGYLASDDHAYTLGIAPPTNAASGQAYVEGNVYANSDGVWTKVTRVLTSAASSFPSSILGQYIQLYGSDDATACTGVITEVTDANTLVVDIDVSDTTPENDAGVSFWISPNRWMTASEYKAQGPLYSESGFTRSTAVLYKQRFKRSGDGARSNTVTLSPDGIGPYGDFFLVSLLVSGLSIRLDISSDDPDVDQIELFRLDTSVTTSDLYRLVATIDLPLTTSLYYDGVGMTGSLTALDNDEKYPCPNILSNLLFYGSRLWGTYANKLYYSRPYGYEEQFQYFGEAGLNYFEFPDTIKTIVDYNRTMLVFLERETWILEGLNPTSMNKRRLNKDVGTYSSTSAITYKGAAFTVSSDRRFYQISGADWSETPQITSLIPSSVSYVQLVGSDNSIWISTGSKVIRYELSNRDAWVYNIGGYLGVGSHTTYVGKSGKVYEIDSTGGSESTPAAYIESPDIYIGGTDGRRGKLSRILFRANCSSGNIKIYVDGALWKDVVFSTSGEQTVSKHFWPVQGYYAKVRISSNQYNELTISGPIILNPF